MNIVTDARMHYHTLTAAGWTLRSIAAHAGVDATSLSRFVRGVEEPPHVIAGILRLDPSEMAERSNHDGSPRVSRIGTTRRLQALMAMGWPASAIGAHIGKPERWIHNKMHQQGSWVLRTTHDLVAKVYRDLAMTPGPSPLTRGRALARGYATPMQWDDIDHDEAPEQIEEVWTPGPRNKQEDYDWLTSNGASHEEALGRVGWTQDGYEKAQERHKGEAA